MLVIAAESMLDTSTDVKITSLGRWSVFGEVIETSSAQVKLHTYKGNINLEAASWQDSRDSCECSREPEPFPSAAQNLGQQISNCGREEALVAIVINNSTKRNHIGGGGEFYQSTARSMLLRKKKLQGPVWVNDVNANKFLENQEIRRMGGKLATMDCIWLSGIIASFLTTTALLIYCFHPGCCHPDKGTATVSSCFFYWCNNLFSGFPASFFLIMYMVCVYYYSCCQDHVRRTDPKSLGQGMMD